MKKQREEMSTNKRIRIDDEGMFLTALSMDAVKKLPAQTLTVRLMDGKQERRFATVRPYGERRDYLADVVTGTLYDHDTGRCLTGPLQIEMPKQAKAVA